MLVKQDRKAKQGKKRRFYLIGSLSFLILALLVTATILFQDEIRHIQGYGYIGAFVVGILCGLTVIPTPTQLLIFSLGHVLNPIYVGLAAGFGGAIGGILVYMTGAGAAKVLSRFLPKQPTTPPPDPEANPAPLAPLKFWSKGQAFYNRIAKWGGGKGGVWTVFISSVMPISPYYFAGLAAGSLHMGLLKFFLLSWAGKTVRNVLIASAGYWGLGFFFK